MIIQFSVLGSPPRVRGKPAKNVKTGAEERITPACAGKTSIFACSSLKSWDHPRVCGENLKILVFKVAALGSPPRVRGKRSGQYSMGYCCRITPACAGKTSQEHNQRVSRQDHPRVCGENKGSSASEILSSGSPPRVRGKLRVKLVCMHSRGITPACAGKTSLSGCTCRAAWDHPRVCGENDSGR